MRLSLRASTLLLLVASFGVSILHAQRPGADAPSEFLARYSYTAGSDLSGGSRPARVSIDSLQLSLRSSRPVTESTQLTYGVAWARHDLAFSDQTSLPDQLQSIAIPLGFTKQFNPRWLLLAQVQPRFAGAGSGTSGEDFDVPVMLLATYSASPELTWLFGLRYGSRSDWPVLPLAGVVWRFAPEWEFRLAWPESGLVYRLSPVLTLRAGAMIFGGDFRVDQPPGGSGAGVDAAEAAGDWLEYREIRTGLAVAYMFSPQITLRIDAGTVVSQRFEYVERGSSIKGGTPAYLGVSFTGRF